MTETTLPATENLGKTARAHKGRRRLDHGQTFSTKWRGYIHVKGNTYKKHTTRDTPDGPRLANTYHVDVPCTQCGRDVLQNRSNHRRGNRPFCSKSCRSKALIKEATGNVVKKKRATGDYHVYEKMHSHPSSDRHGLVPQHRLVVEKAIGRLLLPEERVHHINCVKNDNRIENLVVCSSDREHFLAHGSLNKCVAALIENGVLRFDAETMTYEVVQC